MKITQELLHQLFNYNPLTGIFLFKERTSNLKRSSKDDVRWNKRYAGKVAGFDHYEGYRSISIYGKQQMAHRMAFLYTHGFTPEIIDHINQDKKDNRISNLRPASKSENAMNAKRPSTSSSGIKGVSFHKPTGKWRARVMVDKKEVHLGLFFTAPDAAIAVTKARAELHGEFACNG